jgi:hypothetical protein
LILAVSSTTYYDFFVSRFSIVLFWREIFVCVRDIISPKGVIACQLNPWLVVDIRFGRLTLRGRRALSSDLAAFLAFHPGRFAEGASMTLVLPVAALEDALGHDPELPSPASLNIVVENGCTHSTIFTNEQLNLQRIRLKLPCTDDMIQVYYCLRCCVGLACSAEGLAFKYTRPEKGGMIVSHFFEFAV